MIIGLGLDIVDNTRLKRSWQRFGRHFAERILHASELAALPSNDALIPSFLASRFAAKEAAVKALGTGFSKGIAPQDIELVKLSSGAPQLIFHGAAALKMKELGATCVLISISHEKNNSVAVVILES